MRGRGREWVRGRKNFKTKMRISRHTDSEVYRKSFAAAMEIFRISKDFSKEERYSLTDQV